MAMTNNISFLFISHEYQISYAPKILDTQIKEGEITSKIYLLYCSEFYKHLSAPVL